jgi:NAD(P)H-dependent FMN reductase
MTGFVSESLLKITQQKLEAEGAKVHVIDLANMNLGFPYGRPTRAFLKVETELRGVDGVVVVVPEYQGSYPGILKLFLDQLAYPYSPLKNKVATFVGYSGGGAGGIVPVETLSRDFQTQGAHIFSDRTFIPQDSKNISGDGVEITDPAIDARLNAQLHGFVGFLTALETGRRGEPTGELFTSADRLQAIRDAGIDLAEFQARLVGAVGEKQMVDVEIGFFKRRHHLLSAEDQARFWEELSHEVDVKLNYRRTHVARGYRWEHDGETYFVYQGPLVFAQGQHATLVIEPSGTARAGLVPEIFDIHKCHLDLKKLAEL